MREHMQDLHTGQFRWTLTQLRAGNTIRANALADLPPAAEALRAATEAQGGQSIVVAPVRSKAGLRGSVGYASVRKPRAWDDLTVAALRFFGDILANALERRRHEVALREREERYQLAVRVGQAGVWD